MISSIAGTAINTGLNYLTNKFGNSALQLNGTPSKTTTTSSNNILKTGYEPYKSGYVD
jgi:hypothetical protein